MYLANNKVMMSPYYMCSGKNKTAAPFCDAKIIERKINYYLGHIMKNSSLLNQLLQADLFCFLIGRLRFHFYFHCDTFFRNNFLSPFNVLAICQTPTKCH